MRRKAWLGIFSLALLCELLCIQLSFTDARFVTKPLLVLLLIGYFLSQVKGIKNPLKIVVVLALAFSWLGDVLLLFEYQASLFFILGLSSFLIAHLFYIYLFNKIRLSGSGKINSLLLLPVVIYYAALIRLLTPHLGAMKWPVYVYGLAICIMLLVALHTYTIRKNGSGRYLLLGAILFVVSDSALAINKFYAPFNGAGIIIMLTYGLAQWCITDGCIRWFHSYVDLKAKRVVVIT